MNTYFDLYNLPFEIQCNIISIITEYRDILRLRLVNKHMKLLIEKSIIKIDREYIKNDKIKLSSNILSTIKNVKSIIDIFPETLDELINIANLPHLKETHIGIDNEDPIVKKYNFNFDQILSIFTTQYCSGTYLNNEHGLFNICKNKKTYSDTCFWIEYYDKSPVISKDVYIKNGVVSMYKYCHNYPLFIKTLSQEHTLFGIEINYPLTKDIITILENTSEFKEIIIYDALLDDNEFKPIDIIHHNKILKQIRYFIEINKIKILRQNHDYPSSVINANNFLNSFKRPNMTLKIWDIPISVEYLKNVIEIFPTLEKITIYIDYKNDENILINNINYIGNVLKTINNQIKKINIDGFDTGMARLKYKTLCKKFEQILKNIMNKKIKITFR